MEKMKVQSVAELVHLTERAGVGSGKTSNQYSAFVKQHSVGTAHPSRTTGH
jgi:hypothetical protein